MPTRLRVVWTGPLPDLEEAATRSPHSAARIYETVERMASLGWSLGHPTDREGVQYWAVPPFAVVYEERMVPLVPALGRRLRHYARRTRPGDVVSDRIFLSLRRRPGGDYEPLTRSGVDQILRSLATGAPITKPVHAHVFRHSFATATDNQTSADCTGVEEGRSTT